MLIFLVCFGISVTTLAQCLLSFQMFGHGLFGRENLEDWVGDGKIT